MTLPRLISFAALLLLNRRWHAVRWEMPLRDSWKAARLGFVPLLLWAFYFSRSRGPFFPPHMMAVGFFTSMAVGLFEEFAFRGPLLSALRDRFSPLTAVIASNLLFAAYHIQAQPIRFWPTIFLTGVILANLRLRGLSLGWLAFLHGLTDALYFFFPSYNPEPFGACGLAFQAGLLIYAVISFPRSAVTES